MDAAHQASQSTAVRHFFEQDFTDDCVPLQLQLTLGQVLAPLQAVPSNCMPYLAAQSAPPSSSLLLQLARAPAIASPVSANRN